MAPNPRKRSDNIIGESGAAAVGGVVTSIKSLTSLDLGCIPIHLPSPNSLPTKPKFSYPILNTSPVGTTCSTQDLGDSVWLLLAALLPRTTEITVNSSPPVPSPLHPALKF